MKFQSIQVGLLMVMALAGPFSSTQQTSTSTSTGTASVVDKESKAEFDNQNQKGAAAVGAVRATPSKLSAADQKLLMEVVKGGMMQLEVSRVAAQKATNPFNHNCPC